MNLQSVLLFNCTRRIWKVSFFSHCARNFSSCQGAGLRASRSPLSRTSNASTWMCPHTVTHRVECKYGQRFTHLFQCLCTVVFNTDNVTRTAGPQILTCPAVGPNILRKADYATLSLNTQGDTCNNTINERVTTIILMLILTNKNVSNVLVPAENLILFIILISLDLKRGVKILFLGNSKNILKTWSFSSFHRNFQ